MNLTASAAHPNPASTPSSTPTASPTPADYPFAKNPAKVPDHDWHRGVWFAHGLVNGHDLWRELPEKKTGSIVHEALRVTHGKNRDKRPGTGHLVNSAGDRDTPVWGNRAAWCDAHGPLPDGRVIGIALFDHPKNPSHPTWWHARDYGLLSANPFGRHDFEKLKDQPKAGDRIIPAGGELVLRYRLLFHRGDEKSARIAELYHAYATEK